MPDSPVALVTGGAKRVGRAVVERLAAAGFDVGLTYRTSRAEAEAVCLAARPLGVRVIALAADLADVREADALATEVRRQFGRLDLLVNNASLYLPDDGPDGPTPTLQRRLFDVNCAAPVTLMTHLAPDLRASGGAVVNFVDLLAERPWPKYSAYCASKAALRAQTLAYARRLAPEVRVNGISPGVIDWPDEMPDSQREAYLRRVPLARPGTPHEAANVVLWLATSASYVTGQIIGLDGGRGLV